MSKSEWKKCLGVVGRVLLAYALVFAPGAWAMQNQAAKDKPSSPQKAAEQIKQRALTNPPVTQSKQAQGENAESAAGEEKPSGDASHQGIRVHGHWTIEVRNPDGTVVTHREFENSLTAGGATILSSLLSRSVSLGSWTLQVSSSTTPPCRNTSAGVSTACLMHEPGTAFQPDNNSVFTLNVASGAGNTLILSGTAVAGTNGNVDQVQTFSSVCANTFAPSSPCSVAAQLPESAILTSATLASPIVVTQGQTIAATVAISFS